MKNNILDDIFHDKFRNQLSPEEVLVWEGKPKFSNYSRLITFGFLLFFGGIQFYIFFSDKEYGLATFYFVLILYSIYDIIINQKKTRYLITNQRIHFQLPKWMGVQYYSIPFNHLEEIRIVRERK